MKHIAIISLALAPLVAGCAGVQHNTELDAKTASTSRDTSAISKLEARVKKLHWRIRTVDRRLSERSGGGAQTADNEARSELQSVKQRLSELERSTRSHGPSPSSTQVTANEPNIPPDLDEKLTIINQKLARLSASQARPTNGSSGNLTKVVNDLATLRNKLAKLEASKSSSTGSNASLEKRLIKAEVALVDYIKKYDQMSKELERDRTLVVDYLEDLDGRIEAIEKLNPPAPTKP